MRRSGRGASTDGMEVGVSQCGRATSKEEGALIWRSEGHPLVALEWCLHVEVEVGCI